MKLLYYDHGVGDPAGAHTPSVRDGGMSISSAMHDDAAQASDGPRVVRVDDLSRLIQEKRTDKRLTLEQAAQQAGVSAATLSRLERRHKAARHTDSEPSMPDTRTLAAITRWLGVSLERVMDVGTPAPVHQIVHQSGETTPDMVEAHLRADRHLDARTAAALGRIFRAAYEQFAQPQDVTRE